MCIAVFRSVGTVAPRALSGLTGTPAGYPRLAQRKSGRLWLPRGHPTQPTISWKVVTHYATSLTKSRNFCYVMLVVYRTYLIGFTRSQKVVTRCGTSAKVVDQMPPE